MPVSVGAVNHIKPVAASRRSDFKSGAAGSEVQVQAGGAVGDPSGIAGRLDHAHINAYEIENVDGTVVITAVGPHSDPAAVLGALGLSTTDSQVVAVGATILAAG